MKLSELFPQKRVLSFEVFPPKRTSPIGTVYHALSALQGLNPDFISVTYGASGGAGTSDTLNIASSIKKDYMVESVAHLPCISLTKGNVLELLTYVCDTHKITIRLLMNRYLIKLREVKG